MNASIPQPDNNLPDEDRELLSAYLDDELVAAERSHLEQRLQAEPVLQTELEELQATRSLLRSLPALTPPRSFTLDAQNPPPRPFSLAVWLSSLQGSAVLQRAGGAVAAVLLIVVVSVGFLNVLGGQQTTTMFSSEDSGLSGGYAASEPQATGAPLEAIEEATQPTEEAPAAAALAEQEAPAAGDAPQPEAAEGEAEAEAPAEEAAEADAPEVLEIEPVAPARSPAAEAAAAEAAEGEAAADQAASAEPTMLAATPSTEPTPEAVIIATTVPSLVVRPTPPPLDETAGGRMAPQQAEEAMPAEDDAASPAPGTLVPPGIGSSDTSSPDTDQLADGQPQAPSEAGSDQATRLSLLLLALVMLIILVAAVLAWLAWRRRA